MSKQLEATLKAELGKDLVTCGALVLNTHGHAMQRGGVSDLLVWARTWCGGIETKVDDNPTTSGQDAWLADLALRGFGAVVARWRTKAAVWDFEVREPENREKYRKFAFFARRREVGLVRLREVDPRGCR